MRHKVIAGGIAVVGAVLIAAGCTATGTPVAQPGESGPTTTATSTSTTQTTNSRTTTTTSAAASTSESAAPANASTMLCREFGVADLDVQEAVVREYGATGGFTATLFVIIECAQAPDSTVFEVMDGMRPDLLDE